jgi:hypothetical protein
MDELVRERGEFIGMCPLVCRLVANCAASSRASADTEEFVIKKKARLVSDFHGKDPMDAAVLFIARRVVTRRREVQSEFWPDLRQRIH